MPTMPVARVLSSHDRSIVAREVCPLVASAEAQAQLLDHWPALAVLVEELPRGAAERLAWIVEGSGAALAIDGDAGKALFLGTIAQLSVLRPDALDGAASAVARALSDAVDSYYAPRGATTIGGKPFEWGARTFVMGVVNATPDSFSGDGVGDDIAAAVAQAERFVAEGADIVDVGGESTRPRSKRVAGDEELRRVLPIVQRLARELPVPVSVDTYRAAVAERCLDAGAAMVNDVWGLRADPAMAALVARYAVPVVLMHNQQGIAYRDLMGDIVATLRASVAIAAAAGIPSDRLIVDPGIGFGKSKEQNLEVLHRLDELKVLGRPILLGTSRKSTIGFVLNLPPEDRVEGTAATVALGIALGADIVRVHDVRQMVRVCQMSDAVARWRPTDGEQHWLGQTG